MCLYICICVGIVPLYLKDGGSFCAFGGSAAY